MTVNKCSIDWKFIGDREGFRTEGYVPSDKSGVTIASGFDLGQIDLQHLKTVLNQDLMASTIKMLTPYLGFKGDAARKLLHKHPLELTTAQCYYLDTLVFKKHYEACKKEYNDHSDFSFDFLDTPKQTAIMSVSFQYGSLKKKCPKFFKSITKGLWKEAVEELRNFGDAYAPRRKLEADLLESSLKKEIK